MKKLLRTAIATGSELNAEALTQLRQDGFCVVPGPFPPRAMSALVNAYDRAMVEADPGERRVGRTTVRVNDLINRGPEFDSIYLYPPLLDACWQILGRPFKLSVLHGRTLLPERPAQDWHVDYPLDTLGWTMVGFIFMIDEFRKENGATSFLRSSHLQAASHAPDWPGDDGMRTGRFHDPLQRIRMAWPRVEYNTEIEAIGAGGVHSARSTVFDGLAHPHAA